ncbi:hypothetical protein ACPA9J_03745 [Pseudomonas aeruginosa]
MGYTLDAPDDALRHKPRQSRPASLALRVTALVGIATTLVFLVSQLGHSPVVGAPL